MGNVASWLTGCLFPEEQAPWHAANAGDHRGLREAIARITPETQYFLEWRDSCSGRTPLAQASAKGRLQCVVDLVHAGVNVNAKDFKGNTPLHLASRHGHADVVRFLVNIVQVVPFEVNMQLQTPLDVARDRLRRRGCDDTRHHKPGGAAVGYEACIEELEKKFYLYSGWVYEKTDNLISAVSGISNLSSWKHRFCIVLQRGLPDVLELALFSARKGDLRPTLPSSVILYHVQSGFHQTTDAKWFNKKEYAFTITGSVLQRDGQWEERRRAAPTQAIELAAVDAEGFQMWKSFFHHHEEMLAASRLAGSSPYYTPPPPPATKLPPPPSAAPLVPVKTDYKAYPADYVMAPRQESNESSRSSIMTMSTLRDEDQEEEDLRRAIELSLRDSTVMGAQPTHPIQSSAPAWTDDEADGLSGSYTGQSDASSLVPAPLNEDDGSEEKAPVQPLTGSSGGVPSYASIGECVVCFDGPQAAVCVPCGHNAVCMTCAEEILETSCECPVCRHPIREVIKLYRV